jgi:hypothetical protein
MRPGITKLKLIEDVEDRLKDEIPSLAYIQSELKQKLHLNSTNEREVRFSELVYDESCDLLVKTMDSMRSSQRVQDFQNQVKRIYKYRVEAATRDSLIEKTESPWIIHSEVVGNILEQASYNKDLLQPFFNKALPRQLRRNVWRALLTYPEAEEDYLVLFKEAKWKTISLNEVEITRKSVELLSEHCGKLAYNEKVVTAMKVVLSYIEKIIERRLPEYMFYIMLPIMYILSDLASSLPRLIGICLKLAEIQTTVWLSSKETPLIQVFFQSLDMINPQVTEKIHSLLDLNFQENNLKLENFIRPFIARLSTSYFHIDTTCVVYDQLIMINTLNKMLFILALSLDHISSALMTVQHWDDFCVTFLKGMKKISPLTLESFLERLPATEDLEAKVKIPADLKGQDYLQYRVQAQFDLEDSKTNQHGDLLSHKRILAEDPVFGIQQQKIMKNNLMEAALNQSVRPDRKRNTLINANLTRISVNSRERFSGQVSPALNLSKESKVSKEIINLSGSNDMFIEENSFPRKKKDDSSKSIFQDSSFDPNVSPMILKNNRLADSTFDQKNMISSNRTIKDVIPSSKLEYSMEKPNFQVSPRIIPSDMSGESPRIPPGQENSFVEDLQDLSYLECGILGVPDFEKLKPRLLDGFDD